MRLSPNFAARVSDSAPDAASSSLSLPIARRVGRAGARIEPDALRAEDGAAIVGDRQTDALAIARLRMETKRSDMTTTPASQSKSSSAIAPTFPPRKPQGNPEGVRFRAIAQTARPIFR